MSTHPRSVNSRRHGKNHFLISIGDVTPREILLDLWAEFSGGGNEGRTMPGLFRWPALPE